MKESADKIVEFAGMQWRGSPESGFYFPENPPPHPWDATLKHITLDPNEEQWELTIHNLCLGCYAPDPHVHLVIKASSAEKAIASMRSTLRYLAGAP